MSMEEFAVVAFIKKIHVLGLDGVPYLGVFFVFLKLTSTCPRMFVMSQILENRGALPAYPIA